MCSRRNHWLEPIERAYVCLNFGESPNSQLVDSSTTSPFLFSYASYALYLRAGKREWCHLLPTCANFSLPLIGLDLFGGDPGEASQLPPGSSGKSPT